MFLFKILNIEINFSVFIAFFIGIGLGFLLLLLIYLYAVLKGLNKELRLNKVMEEDIDEEEIKWMIESAQTNFKDTKRRNEEGYSTLLLSEIKSLTYDISKKFYPDSPYPYLELTIDETLELTHYISDRMKELLNNRLLKLFRGMTLRTIAELNNTKTKIEENKIVQASKKVGLGKIVSNTLKVVNIANPFYWFKKATVDQAIKIIMVKIGLSLIAISGEETYKIYSKKVFNVDKTIETNANDLYESIKKDLEEAGENEWSTKKSYKTFSSS